jgi:hypothetical protein
MSIVTILIIIGALVVFGIAEITGQSALERHVADKHRND